MRHIDSKIYEKIRDFANIGEVYILTRSAANEYIKLLRSHPKKKFKIAHSQNYSNIWRSK